MHVVVTLTPEHDRHKAHVDWDIQQRWFHMQCRNDAQCRPPEADVTWRWEYMSQRSERTFLSGGNGNSVDPNE